MSMTGNNRSIEVLSGLQRRRRWSAAEMVAIAAETYEPGMTVSLVAGRYEIAPSQLLTSRKLASQGALTVAGTEVNDKTGSGGR